MIDCIIFESFCFYIRMVRFSCVKFMEFSCQIYVVDADWMAEL